MVQKVNDPLEAAKVGEDAPKKKGWGKKKKAEEAAPAPEPAPEPVKVEEAAPVKAASPSGVKKYRILEDKVMSYRGSMTRMKKDTVISSQHYGGEPGIEKLMDAGLKLEEV